MAPSATIFEQAAPIDSIPLKSGFEAKSFPINGSKSKALEDALATAARKYYKTREPMETVLDRVSGQMTMYVINEPTPPGFRPNTSMLARDENQLPISSSSGMWAHIVKTLFVTSDGLATLQTVLTVTLDPLTIGKPHPVPDEDTDEIEEVWTALDGTSLAMVGNQLRRQPPGTAYLHIPDNKTPHTNINSSEDSQDKFLYFARYRSHEMRK